MNTTSKKRRGLKLLLLAIVLISAGKSYGQSKQELSLHFNSPMASLSFEQGQGEQSMGDGLGLGVTYSYYLNENWSLATGAEIQSFSGDVRYDAINDAFQTTDIEGEEFEFRYTLRDFSEEKETYYLNIPLKIQYETTGQIRFFAAGGAKIGFNVDSKYRSQAASLVTSGYYSQYDAELNAPEFMGFGDFAAIATNRKSEDLKTSYMLSMETGLKFLLKNDQAFYVGLFLDYGLNDLKKETPHFNLITYKAEDPTSFSLNSILASVNTLDASEYIQKVQNMALGVKIAYALGI